MRRRCELEDYTKYALKPREELAGLLKDAGGLFVVACGKCFKKFETTKEPEREALEALARELGVSVLGAMDADFLCNSTRTEKALADAIPEGTQTVAVIACGLGIQTVAALTGKPVLAAADSVYYRGRHGMALTERRCDACAQCYLNLTGGICPVVDCSKSLLNGQCGGAKDGKCEVDPSRDCAWEKIYQKLKSQGRLEEFNAQPVQLRDWSKANHKTVTAYVKAIREKRLEGYYGGVHPLERKEPTEGLPLERFPVPETVVIPLSQHIGAPAEPLVQPGDSVKVGQKIGRAASAISANVHASVSGTVVAVEPRLHPTIGREALSVVIRSDGLDTFHESVVPRGDLETLTPGQIADIVRESGIVGMGGAGFPTDVKLKPQKQVDTVLLNGCECEPILTADHRVLLEYPDRVIFGLRAILKAVGAEQGVIVIEDNKPDAIALLEEKTAGLENIRVQPVRTKYPQGAEKTLIRRVTGRQVPSGGLPADVGVVVSNVSTAKAIADAIQTGMPLIERAVTVSGEKIKRPGNYLVRIGTGVKALLDRCGGLEAGEVTVKMGGPMMGFALGDTDVPVVKGTNGVIALETDHTQALDCIRCGRCVDVCPMELTPLYLSKYAQEGNVQGLLDRHVMDCVECRCCEYICSAKIPLVSHIQAGKRAVKEAK